MHTILSDPALFIIGKTLLCWAVGLMLQHRSCQTFSRVVFVTWRRGGHHCSARSRWPASMRFVSRELELLQYVSYSLRGWVFLKAGICSRRQLDCFHNGWISHQVTPLFYNWVNVSYCERWESTGKWCWVKSKADEILHFTPVKHCLSFLTCLLLETIKNTESFLL